MPSDHFGGGFLAHKSLPAITRAFVMRDEPWNKLMKSITDNVAHRIQRVVVVSGMAGCGKTQLCTKFAHEVGSRYAISSSIDSI
jgi:tRNA A37 threonylcarbamoyladenosine biosynthesis protein TsaE